MSRIGSRYIAAIAYRQDAPTAYELLSEANAALDGSATAATFLPLSREIVELLETIESGRPNTNTHRTNLGSLIEKVAILKKSVDIDELLRSIPRAQMRLGRVLRLVDMLRKLAVYREVSKFLVRSIRDHPALVDISVLPVILPDAAFRPLFEGGDIYDVEAVLIRTRPAEIKLSLSKLCERIPIDREEARRKFRNALQAIRKESTIHAEIQILTHYDLKPAKYPPRIIVSSKLPCPLCRAFFLCHRTYAVPESHGTLYRLWRLPAVGVDSPVLQRFHSFLENESKRIITALAYFSPYAKSSRARESGILQLLSSSSLDRLTQAQEAPDPTNHPDLTDLELDLTDRPDLTDMEPDLTNRPDLTGMEPDLHIEETIRGQQSPGAGPSAVSPIAELSEGSKSSSEVDPGGAAVEENEEAMLKSLASSGREVLVQGRPVSGIVSADRPSLTYQTPSLLFTVEYTADLDSKRPETSIEFLVEWLEDVVAAPLRTNAKARVFDCEKGYLDDLEVSQGKNSAFHLMYGRNVVRVHREPET